MHGSSAALGFLFGVLVTATSTALAVESYEQWTDTFVGDEVDIIVRDPGAGDLAGYPGATGVHLELECESSFGYSAHIYMTPQDMALHISNASAALAASLAP